MNADLTKIYSSVPGKKADLILLVLASQGIKTWTRRGDDGFDILVEAGESDSALAAVDAYYHENKWFGFRRQIQQVSLSSFSSPAAFCIMGLLCFIHWAGFYYNSHDVLVLRCGASALYILQGETYRAVTALFLHADIQHLAGNLAGILLFTAPVIRISGYGSGLFILLFCSTSANLINAHLQQNAHLSIGSSTLVMASAGLLCAFQTLRKEKKRMNAIMPIFAGSILVVLLSQGERTDVWAHVLGFACGLACGPVFFPVNRLIRFPQKEIYCLLLTVGVVLSAFFSVFFRHIFA